MAAAECEREGGMGMKTVQEKYDALRLEFREFREEHGDCVDAGDLQNAEDERDDARYWQEEAQGRVDAVADFREALYWQATREPGNTLATLKADGRYMAITEALGASMVGPVPE